MVNCFRTLSCVVTQLKILYVGYITEATSMTEGFCLMGFGEIKLLLKGTKYAHDMMHLSIFLFAASFHHGSLKKEFTSDNI